MCVSVEIDGKHIQTIGELRAALGDDKVAVESGYTLSAYLENSMCLCPVDIDTTAELVGRIATPCDWDPMCYRFDLATPPSSGKATDG